MQFLLYYAIVIFQVLKNVQTHQNRVKRAHADNFNVLLNIYKMNPLKKSNVYKTFSDQVLLPNRPDIRRVAMNFDSNESRKERLENTNLHLKQIEKFIHVTNTKKKVFKQPDYDIENIDPEKFTINMIMNDPLVEGANENEKVDENNFNSIFGHLDSGEIGDKLPVTKMVRVNNLKTYNKIKSRPNLSDYDASKVNYDNLNDNKTNETISTISNHVEELKDVRNFVNEGVVVLR